MNKTHIYLNNILRMAATEKIWIKNEIFTHVGPDPQVRVLVINTCGHSFTQFYFW